MALSESTIFTIEVVIVVIFVLLLLGIFVFFVYAVGKKLSAYLGYNIPIDAPIIETLNPKLSQGYSLFLLVYKSPAKYGRIRIKGITLDNPYDNRGGLLSPKEITFCCKASQLKVYPKGSVSSHRDIGKIFVNKASELPELLRNDGGGYYSERIEHNNRVDNAILALDKTLDSTIKSFKGYDKSDVIEALRGELFDTIKKLRELEGGSRREQIIMDTTATEKK